MPVEIRELIIRTVVTGEESGSSPQTASGGQAGGGAGKSNMAEIVAECVEQVMEILREERER